MTENSTKHIFIDVEVFPDYFLLVAKEYFTNKALIVEIYEGCDKANIEKFKNFVNKHILQFIKLKEYDIKSKELFIKYDEIIKNKYIVGFNIYEYDLPVILYMYYILNEYKDKIFEKLLEFNTTLVNGNEYIDKLDLPKYLKYKYKDSKMEEICKKVFNNIEIINIVDIYKINGWDDDSRRASLKWLQCSTMSDNVIESNYDFNKPLLEHGDKGRKDTIRYCLNDVDQTIRVYNVRKEVIENRYHLRNMYLDKYIQDGKISYYKLRHINKLLRNNSTQFGYFILFEEITGLEKDKINKIIERRKTLYSNGVEVFELGEIINKKVKLKDKDIFEQIKKTKIYENTSRNKRSEEVKLNNYKLTYIIGKEHSKNKN